MAGLTFRQSNHRTMHPRPVPARVVCPVIALVTLAACARSSHTVAAPGPAPARARAAAIHSGTELVAAMHGRYAGKWYRTLRFRQTTTIYRSNGGEYVQTWHEAVRVPGALRIDTDTLGGGFLFAGDSVYTFVNGRLAHANPGRNELLVLGFDVYGQPAARSEHVLRSLGFDLSKFHESTWNGKPVYVVGALAGDTTSKQFWVSQDDLLFVRMLQLQESGRTRQYRDVRFERYVPAGGGWVATEVLALTNGRRSLMERYADVRADVPLSDDVFEPRQWSATRHWMQ